MNLRKDHYRLLVSSDLLTRLTPLGICIGKRLCYPIHPWSFGLSAKAHNISAGLFDLPVSSRKCGWPTFAEVLYPILITVCEGSCGISKQFKELSPQPGFVISPLDGTCNTNLIFSHLFEMISGRKSENPKHNTIQWIIWLGGR